MSADKGHDDQQAARATTATPFLIALAIALVLVAGVVTWSFTRSNDGPSDHDQVVIAVGQYYGALNKGRYADLVANTCAKDRAAPGFPQEAGFADARKAAVEREGEAELDRNGIKDVTVTGDTATAKLTVKYGKSGERSEQANFVREDDKWKKCS